MKVLFVAANNKSTFAPFVLDQAEALSSAGVEVELFGIRGNGVLGYLANRKDLIARIRKFNPDLVHAHYGLSGLLTNLQRKVPVITTYHGCDINRKDLRRISILTIWLSRFNIFVSNRQVDLVKRYMFEFEVIPCGINLHDFIIKDKMAAREKLGLDPQKKYILFSSDFARPEKNASLAIEACKLIENAELLELKGYSRNEVVELMNAVDVGLLTSLREGSPMFVKEMLACRKPVVSTDVGDVSELIKNIEGCFIVPYDPQVIAARLKDAFNYPVIDVPEDKIKMIDNKLIATRLIDVYRKITREKS
jgi:glycosyltransferase involved in cell wall biosynthesis